MVERLLLGISYSSLSLADVAISSIIFHLQHSSFTGFKLSVLTSENVAPWDIRPIIIVNLRIFQSFVLVLPPFLCLFLKD